MNIPNDLKYAKTHEWTKVSGNIAEIGITDHAQQALGDIVFISLPSVGDTVTIGESFGEIESVKAVSEAFSSVDGTITEINESLSDSPDIINSDPYGSWIIKVDFTIIDDLLDANAYEEHCNKED